MVSFNVFFFTGGYVDLKNGLYPCTPKKMTNVTGKRMIQNDKP